MTSRWSTRRVIAACYLLLSAWALWALMRHIVVTDKQARLARHTTSAAAAPCTAVLQLALATDVCGLEGSACGCKPSAPANSRYALLVVGGLRSFAAAHFSMQRFLVDENSPIDVFFYGTYEAGVAQDEKALEAVREMATGFVMEPYVDIPVYDGERPTVSAP